MLEAGDTVHIQRSGGRSEWAKASPVYAMFEAVPMKCKQPLSRCCDEKDGS